MAINVNNNSNAAALIALQNLANTQDQLTQTQNQVSTGLAVQTPQDNAAIWSIAQGQQLQIGGLDAVTQSLSRASSISVFVPIHFSIAPWLSRSAFARPRCHRYAPVESLSRNSTSYGSPVFSDCVHRAATISTSSGWIIETQPSPKTKISPSDLVEGLATLEIPRKSKPKP